MQCLTIFALVMAPTLSIRLPPTLQNNEPKAGIFYLVSVGDLDGITELKTSLKSLCDNIEGHYPILLFHGSKLTDLHKLSLTDLLESLDSKCLTPGIASRTEWVRLNAFDPDAAFGGDLQSKSQHNDNEKKFFAKSKTRDYNRMIQFWLDIAIDYASARGFKYMMRLDTDSVIASRPAKDLFMEMQEKNAKYGYRSFCYENPDITPPEKVWPLVKKYVALHKVNVSKAFEAEMKKAETEKSNALPMFYSNFEIVDVDFFSQPRVSTFGKSALFKTTGLRKEMGRSDGPLGDAVVRALQVGIFADEREVLHLNNFRYFHGHCPECREYDYTHPVWSSLMVIENDAMNMEWGAPSHRFGDPDGVCLTRGAALLGLGGNFTLNGTFNGTLLGFNNSANATLLRIASH